MNANPSELRLPALVRQRPVQLAVGAVGVVVLGFFLLRSPGPDGAATAWHEVKRADFTVSVVEGGTLTAVSEVSIRSEVEGTARIISIVPEGTYVQKDDLLVELDSAQAQDQVNQQLINVEKARFAVTNAEAQLEIQRSATNSDFLAAELKLKFAEIDRDKYMQGQRLVDLVEATNRLVSAEANLKVNELTLTNSVRLAEKGYETRQKVDGDRLTVLNNQNSLIVASNAIEMLIKFDEPKQTNKFHSDVYQAQQELERVVSQNKRKMAQLEADLKSQINTLELNEQKLARDQRNLEKTRIIAPQEGLVVYQVSENRFSSESLIEGGATVRNRQELLKLPDLSRMKVIVKVHESHVSMVHPGLPALVKLQPLPDVRFRGVVEKVAPLPDTQARWGNPNLKVYNTEVYITDPLPNIKPGVSAEAEIIITNIANVLSVPIQAITTFKGKQVAYVLKGRTAEPRPVEVGLFNTKFIEITQGLKEGDRVLLAPPFDTQEGEREGAGLADAEKAKLLSTNAPRRTMGPAAAAPTPAGGSPVVAGTPGLVPETVAGAPGAGQESAPGGRGGSGRRGGANREEMMKQFDKNGDGELDYTERAAMRESSSGSRTNRTERRRGTGEGRSQAPESGSSGRAEGGRTEGGRAP
jgi:HlyD family secretion protein